MGNIRATQIKNIAIELVKKHASELTEDFEHNKEVVTKFTDIKDKDLRNKIAGYATTYRARHEA